MEASEGTPVHLTRIVNSIHDDPRYKEYRSSKDGLSVYRESEESVYIDYARRSPTKSEREAAENLFYASQNVYLASSMWNSVSISRGVGMRIIYSPRGVFEYVTDNGKEEFEEAILSVASDGNPDPFFEWVDFVDKKCEEFYEKVEAVIAKMLEQARPEYEKIVAGMKADGWEEVNPKLGILEYTRKKPELEAPIRHAVVVCPYILSNANLYRLAAGLSPLGPYAKKNYRFYVNAIDAGVASDLAGFDWDMMALEREMNSGVLSSAPSYFFCTGDWGAAAERAVKAGNYAEAADYMRCSIHQRAFGNHPTNRSLTDSIKLY